MTEGNKKRISKFLSLILRHEPQKIGLTLDAQGWADVEELVGKCAEARYAFTKEELEEIVASNNKQRYAFNENKDKIRANQGHSISVDLQLPPVVPPEFLYHGTASRFLTSILEKGIIKGNRQHVHLSEKKETAYKVGSRHGKAVVLVIKSGQMHKDGILFYRSENGVWLTDYIDVKYLSQ